MAKPYAQLRLLSVDVVAGAVGAGIMVSRWTGAEMEWPFFVVLGFCVWLVYTLDHLLDARRLGDKASTDRHRFHHRHFKTLGIVWLVLAAIAGTLAFWKLGEQGIWFGVGMSGLTLLHLFLVKLVGDKTSPFLTKEMGVALVYAAGIWGLPAIKSGAWQEPIFWCGFGIFFLLATINLIEFSIYEVEIDENDGHTSFVRALGKKRARRLVLGLLFLTAFGLLFLFIFDWKHASESGRLMVETATRLQWIYLLMLLLLNALFQYPRYFGINERYRAWGDGAFLIPFLSLWLIPA